MGERKIRDELDQLICDEADTLALLLATPTRTVMVHVTIAHDDGLTRHGHGVAGTTKGSHLRQFIDAAESQLKYLRDKLYRKG